MRTLFVATAIVLLMLSQPAAQGRRVRMNMEKEIAGKLLRDFSGLVEKQGNYKEMGFISPGELQRMEFGEPLQIFMVRLDMLKEYRRGDDPEKLLGTGDRILYPILVNRKIRSSLTLVNSEGNWKAVSFGSPNMIRSLTEVRRRSVENTRLALSSYSLIEVPALNLFFIGHRKAGVLMMTPTGDNASFSFKSGNTLLASTVFETIKTAAKEHDGLPR